RALLFSYEPSLEPQSQCELKLTRRARTRRAVVSERGDAPERRRRGDICQRRAVWRTVEEIEALRPELQTQAFGDVDATVEGNAHLPGARSTRQIAAGTAPFAFGRHRKCG